MGSYRKGLMLSLGLVTAQVDLHAVGESQTTTLHRYCPTHHARLNQQLICKAKGEVVLLGDAVSGAEGPDAIKIVKPNDRPEFPKDEKLTLTPVPAADLEAHTYPEGGFYYCQPSSAATAETWALFHATLTKASNKVAFVARGALRNGGQKLWRLTVFNDYLVLQELRYPESIRPVPGVTWGSGHVELPKPSREHLKLMNQLVETATVAWDRYDTTDPNKARFEQWLAGGTEVPRDNVELPAAPAVSMMDALRESIEATRKTA